MAETNDIAMNVKINQLLRYKNEETNFMKLNINAKQNSMRL